MLKKFLSCLFFMLLLTGCFAKRQDTFSIVGPHDTVAHYKRIPEWVKRTPMAKAGQWLYAVGYSPPAFYYKDTLENAKNAARIEIAKTIKVEIKGVMFDVMVNEKRLVGDKDYIISVSETVVDNVLTGSEIVQTWHDKYGLIGEKGSVFALAKTKSKNVKKEVNKQLNK